MPELPEVETVVRDLRRKIIGRRILDVWTDWPKYFKPHYSLATFKKHVLRKKIEGVERRGKNILIHLSDPSTQLPRHGSGQVGTGKSQMGSGFKVEINGGSEEWIYPAYFIFRWAKKFKYVGSFGFKEICEGALRAERRNSQFAGFKGVGAGSAGG